MIIPDVNLLVYAYRTGAPEHRAARQWWEGTLNGAAEIGIPAPCLFGFVRVMTHPRISQPPAPLGAVLDAVNAWFEQPQVRLLLPGPQHLDIAFRLLREQGVAADLTTDVQLAALAIEYQAQICSNDTDFGRFGGLRWSNPLRQKGSSRAM